LIDVLIDWWLDCRIQETTKSFAERWRSTKIPPKGATIRELLFWNSAENNLQLQNFNTQN
jgi:hypothetical protein